MKDFNNIMDEIKGINDIDLLIYWMRHNKDRVFKLSGLQYNIVLDELYKKIIK